MDELKNIFTVDLEEWFVVEILSKRYSSKDWSNLQSTIEKSVAELLHLLRKHNVKATWFVLGWCADKYPALIQEIFNQGHEIACHSYYHRRVDLIDPDTFKKDTELAINAIVKAIGNVPHGYRAPTWSINSSNAWAFEILANLGFLYDSSVFPIKQHNPNEYQHVPKLPKRTHRSYIPLAPEYGREAGLVVPHARKRAAHHRVLD